MFKTRYFSFSIILKLLNNIEDEEKINYRHGNKAKNLSTSSDSLKKYTRADYFSLNAKMFCRFLQNRFI